MKYTCHPKAWPMHLPIAKGHTNISIIYDLWISLEFIVGETLKAISWVFYRPASSNLRMFKVMKSCCFLITSCGDINITGFPSEHEFVIEPDIGVQFDAFASGNDHHVQMRTISWQLENPEEPNFLKENHMPPEFSPKQKNESLRWRNGSLLQPDNLPMHDRQLFLGPIYHPATHSAATSTHILILK